MPPRCRRDAAEISARVAAPQLYSDWFFHNPISYLRECDGDRCEFWRFRYPRRREIAMEVLVDQARARYPARACAPIIISSFGSGLLYQEFCHVYKLMQASRPVHAP